MQDDEAPPGESQAPEAEDPKLPPKPPSEIELARWWNAYCNLPPPRPWSRLRNIVRAQKARIRKAVLEGWPELGIVAFKDRELVGDSAIAEVVGRVREAATERVVGVVANAWGEAAIGHLALLPKVKGALDTLLTTVSEQVAAASYAKFRDAPDLDDAGKVRRDATGRAMTILKPYVDGYELALAAERLVGALKEAAVLNKALLDSIAPFRDAGVDFSDAPPEVMKYLDEKFGGRAA